MYERADQRFLWNNYLLTEFCVNNHEFCVPIIHGCKLLLCHLWTNLLTIYVLLYLDLLCRFSS